MSSLDLFSWSGDNCHLLLYACYQLITCLLHHGCGPCTRCTDAAKQRTVAYLSGRGQRGKCCCHRPLITLVTPLHLGIWACSSTWRRHTGRHGFSAPHQRITQPTSWPHVASPTWSSMEQVARPATKQFHTSDWRPLETCCWPWTWWCNDAMALAGYTNLMMMMMMMMIGLAVQIQPPQSASI